MTLIRICYKLHTNIKVKLATFFHEHFKYKSTDIFYQILCDLFLDFLKYSNLRKIALYWPIKKNVFFYLWEILVKKFVA